MAQWQNSPFLKLLPADTEPRNYIRKVKEASYSIVNPSITASSKMLHVSKDLAHQLGFSNDELKSNEFLNIFSGKEIPQNVNSFSLNYGGHQFGHWAGQLGDGRAINIGKLKDYEVQLKGVGLTPYSRNADGRAVLRSSIREYLISEAMFHLNVPTTRSLTLVELDEKIERDMLYDGNPKMEKSAVVSRLSPTFIRFGNFEIHAANKEYDILKKLADYTIENYFPEITSTGKEKYIEFFNEVADKTLLMVINWQRVGFVHGVMNTDNMSVLGLTIDYGPFGFMDDYDPNYTPNTTDFTNRRYRFENQAPIAQWNLLQLANALYPLVNDAKPFEEILNRFPRQYSSEYLNMMKSKIGIFKEDENDLNLIQTLEENLQLVPTDYTIFFRQLSKISSDDNPLKVVEDAFYQTLSKKDIEKWENWFSRYQTSLQKENSNEKERMAKMNSMNPKYILRNYMLYEAAQNAENENYSMIDELYNMALNPYDEAPEFENWYQKKPDWANKTIGCSVLSCSS